MEQQQHSEQLNQQQQTQSQANVAGAQLPDETYIEKLFPKCQPPPPKSGQMRGSSQTKAKRQLKSSDRQQQQNKRQTARSRQHQTQNQQPPPARRNLASTNEGIRRSSLGDNNNTNQQLICITPNNNPTETNSKSTSNQYHNQSTESSDNESPLPGIGSKSLGPLKRSESNQFGFDANNNRANEALEQYDVQNGAARGTSQYSKPKTRKYKASKNLQQQLKRSQSSYNKLLHPQPLPVDPSVRSSRDDATPSGTQAELSLESARLPVSTVQAASENQVNKQQQMEKSKRTCRGIVFAEPISTTASDGVSQGGFVSGASPANGPIEEASACASLSAAATVAATASVTVAPALSRARAEKQQRPSQKVAKTADRDLTHVVPKEDSNKTSPGIHPPSASSKPQQPHDIAESKSLKGFLADATNSTSAKLDAEDDDKFINLFVYDNTATSQQTLKGEEKIVDTKQPLLISEQTIIKHANQAQASTYRAGRQLLDADLGEEDLISNDTSTEELCSFGDNNQLDSNLKLKPHTPLTKKILDYDDSPSTAQDQSDSGASSTQHNKSILKQHRSVGTLQTVDEKAECNIDEDNSQDTEVVVETSLTSSKTELIDISDNTTNNSNMIRGTNEPGPIRKGFVPPGFPQRVRPQQTAPPSSTSTNQMSDLQFSPPSLQANPTAPVPLCLMSSDDATKKTRESNLESQPQIKRNPEVSLQPLAEGPHATMENIGFTEESKNVIERNLSEALSKVSLNQPIATAMPQTDVNDNLSATTLRQLKLPNETSHFSAIRSTGTTPRGQDVATLETSRTLSLQFNTLSDAESGLDEQVPPTNVGSTRTMTNKRQQDSHIAAASNVSRYSTPGTSMRVDDDMTPTNKTALVFPRLDEGLSSEAESGEDEIEDDDDRAMEADVDADDDDDDDDEDGDDEDANDDDADSPTLAPGGSSTMQANVDSFIRQQQSLKPQNRVVGSLHQQATNGQQSQDPELSQQIKPSPNAAYSNSSSFISPSDAPLDHNDLKPMPNYSNQNGGQSNYWIGVQPTSQQQATMSSQPTPSSSQQFSIQRNQPQQQGNCINTNNNNANLSRSNSYANREEAKSVNRLSSDTDNETDRLLGSQRNEQLQKMASNELVSNSSSANEHQAANNFSNKQGTNSREVLIEGVLFNVKYLGSTHVECDGRGEKEDRIHQAELAVHEVKFRNGETQSPVEVQLFISTEKIMVLDDKHKKIMMDHSLRTISYIADIGDAIVLIVRKKSANLDNNNDLARPISKTSCHVFESNESHTITKSISQAFQVAYTELLKANGAGSGIGAVEPNNYSSIAKAELDYQDVLNTQEMSMTELEMFARKENQREIIVPKQKGEILGISIVESGWGSVLPTAVIASVKQDQPAYRCKKLSVGDQILSINGVSLVGLSLVECQKILRRTKSQTVAKLTVVPCPITVEVKIKRPDTKYQLGFSVQHGVICSLLRGGIAERGGVRVGHRIISINGQTVVGVPHDKIVTLLASSIGEIRMKTCLTSLYRHMLGEEKNVTFV